MATSESQASPKLKNSLLISLLAVNLGVETGSHVTASATTQFPNSPVVETLREKPVLTGLSWRRIFDAGSPVGGVGWNQGLVSGRKNPGPGAGCLKTGIQNQTLVGATEDRHFDDPQPQGSQ